MNCGRAWVAGGLASLLALAAAMPGDARAQQIYKIIGPDGRVTFSDKPPLEPNGKGSSAAAVTPRSGGNAAPAFPFELRQAASRYPVTLYTAPGCQPCASGRAMLSARGVPFSERTISSNEDIEALKRLADVQNVPLLTVGTQQLKGFSEPEWVQYLDAAGYPKISQLPPGYQPAPAMPMVAAQAPQRAPAPAAPPPPSAPESQPEPAENPAGIKF